MKAIKKLMLKYGSSLAALALMIGVSFSYYGNYIVLDIVKASFDVTESDTTKLL